MTAFKTLALRIQGAETELQDLGEETDAYTKSTSKLRDLVMGLTGVDLLDDAGEFRSVYDILVDIGKVWDDLNSVDQASLLEALAGKRQSNNLAAVLNNVETLESAYATATNAEGSAEEEERHYEESITYHLGQLSAAWQELQTTFVDTDFVNAAVSRLTGLVDVVTNLVDALNGAGPAVAALGWSFGALKVSGKTKNLDLLNELFGTQTKFLNKDSAITTASDVLSNFISSNDLVDIDEAKAIDGIENAYDAAFKTVGSKTNYKKFTSQFYNSMNSTFTDAIKEADFVEEMEKVGAKSAIGFGDGFGKNLTRNLVSMLKSPVGLAVAAGIGAVLANWIWDQVHQTSEELSAEYSNYSDSYVEDTTLLDNYNSSLEENKSRLEELAEAKSENWNEEYSLAQQAEIEAIEEENAQLERRIELQEKLAEYDAKAAVKKLEADTDPTLLQWISDSIALGAVDYEAGQEILASEHASLLEQEMTKAQKYQEQISNIENQIAENEEKMYSADGEELERLKEKNDELSVELATYQGYLSDSADTLSDYQESYTNAGLSNTELNNMLNSINQIDMTSSEKLLDNIESFFEVTEDGDGNALYDYLVGVSEKGEDVETALTRLGLSLSDLGLDAKENAGVLNGYFDDITHSVQGAVEATKEFEGTYDEIVDAQDTVHTGEQYENLADYIATAQELYEHGMTGVDDYKSVVEFLTPDDTSLEANLAQYKYDVDAYTEAWEELAKAKAEYFAVDDTSTDDVDEQVVALRSFLEDLTSKGLANQIGDEFTWNFTDTQTVADEMGMQVEAVEALFNSLRDFGFEFGDVDFGGERLTEFKSAIASLEEVYDSLDNKSSSLAQKLSSEIAQYESLAAQAESDLSVLDQDRVVNIEFEYDLASLLAEIDNQTISFNISNDLVEGAKLIATQIQAINKLEGQTDVTSSTDNTYAALEAYREKVSSEIESETDEDQRKILAGQLSDVQSVMLEYQQYIHDMQDMGYEYDWDSFFNQSELTDIIGDISSELGSLGDEDVEAEYGVTVDKSKLKDGTKAIEDSVKDSVNEAEDIAEDADVSVDAEATLDASDVTAGASAAMSSLTTLDNTTAIPDAILNDETLRQQFFTELERLGLLDQFLATPTAELEDSAFWNKIIAILNQLGKLDGYNATTYITTVHREVTEDQGVTYTDSLGNVYRTNPGTNTSETLYENKNEESNGGTIGSGSLPTTSSDSDSGSGGSDDSADEFAESIDWIEVKLNNLERVIDRLDTKASFTFKSWTYRNKQLVKEIDNVAKSIAVYEKAAKAYNKEANKVVSKKGVYTDEDGNKVKLNKKQQKKYNKAVKKYKKTGAYDIQTIKDEDLYNALQQTFDLIDKSRDAKDKALEAQQQLSDLYVEAFENVQTKFEQFVDRIENIEDQIDSHIDLTGFTGGNYQAYYDQWQAQQSQRISTLKTEESKLQKKLADYAAEFGKNSEEYRNLELELMDVQSEILEAQVNQAEKWIDEFDRIQEDYEARMSYFDTATGIVDSIQSANEARGYGDNTAYAQAKITLDQNSLSVLDDQIAKSQAQINDMIAAGYSADSTEVKNLQNQVNELIAKRYETIQDIAEQEQEIYEITKAYYDLQNDWINDATDQLDLFRDILETESDLIDKFGNFTDEGAATMASYLSEMEINNAQIASYQEKIAEYDKAIAADPNNKQLIEDRQEYVKALQDEISANEEIKESVKSLWEDAYEQELAYLQELIDKRKEALESQKDMYEYQKSISEKSDNVASLEKQLAAYGTDTSEEGMAKTQELQTQLDEAKQDLQETQWDRYISDTEDMLDDLYDDYEDLIDARLDNIDRLMEQSNDLVEANTDAINQVVTGMTQLDTSMGGVNTDTGSIAAMISQSGTLGGDVNKIMDAFQNEESGLLVTFDGINTSISSIAEQLSSLGITDTSGETDYTGDASSSGGAEDVASNAGASENANRKKAQALFTQAATKWRKSVDANHPHSEQYQKFLDIIDTLWVDETKRANKKKTFTSKYEARKKKKKGGYKDNGTPVADLKAKLANLGFKKGGTIGDVIKSSGEDGFILARTGEEVLSLERIRQLQEVFSTLDNIANVSVPDISDALKSSSNGVSVDNMSVSFELPNVNNYEDFVNQAQSDSRFQKIVQQMTLGTIMGQNSLKKYKY